MTWAYGNVDDSWNPRATLPIQGVMGVASTDDRNLGLRNGCASDFPRPIGESKGNPLEPSTWPDVAAPGSDVETTNAISVGHKAINPTTTRIPQVDEYRAEYGTSLSAAHTAGSIALLLQANPDLTPAEVEWILEDTATEPPEDLCEFPYNKGDPTHPTSAANHVYGHGLIDAHNATQTAIGFEGIPETDAEAVEPGPAFLKEEDRTDVDTVRVQDRLYLTGDGGISETRPTESTAETIESEANEPVTFTSAPFEESRTVSGIDASIWMSINTERFWQGQEVVGGNILLEVEQVGPDRFVKNGVVTGTPWRGDIGQGNLDGAFVTPERPFMRAAEDPLSIEPGDKLRINIKVNTRGLAGPGSEVTTFEVTVGSERYPSHVGIGERAPDAPRTYRACRENAPNWCAWIDADHPSAQTDFDGGHAELKWEGPGGSGAEIVTEDSVTRDCTVPADEAWGQCVVRLHDFVNRNSNSVTHCRVLDQPGPIQGHGTCRPLKH